MNCTKPKCVWLSLVFCICLCLVLDPTEVYGQADTAKPLEDAATQAADNAQPEPPVDETDVLNAVRVRMTDVQKLLVDGQTAAQTQQIQREIIADLQRLLDQHNQNQSATQSSVEQQKTEQNDESTDPELAGKTGKQESEATAGTDQSVTQQNVLSKEFQEKIWGHLPDRLRDQMRNIEVEKFLPKYEQLIRAYYRRLAEQMPDR